MNDSQDATQGIPIGTDPSQGVPPQGAPMPSQTDGDDDGQPDDDEDTTPKPSSEPTALAAKDNDEHMQIIGKTDEHVAALTTDPDMLQHMQQMNIASNQANPPSNSGSFGSSMGSGMSVGVGVTQGSGMGMGGMGMGGMGMSGGMGGMGMGGMGGGQMGMGVVVQGNMTSAGNNAAQGADVLVANTNEDWINKKWRPVMGWMYMGVCVFDFVIAPILWSIVQAIFHGAVNVQWQPLTLQGAGLFHVAMGAVLGIAAYGRTQEKIQGVSSASTATPVGIAPPAPPAPTGLASPSGFGGGMSGAGGLPGSSGLTGFH
jgi:hypothetical protein